MTIRPIRISRLCKASFADMVGDEQTRFCGECGKNVYDLSARTEDEARKFLNESLGKRICVRYAKDGSGGIRFRAAGALAALSLAACSAPHTNQASVPSHATAGSTNAEPDHDMGDGIPDAVDVCPDPDSLDAGTHADDGCPEAHPKTTVPDAGKSH